jgi:hypothetical protein
MRAVLARRRPAGTLVSMRTNVVLGFAVVGADVGMAAGRAALAPVRLAARAPLVGALTARLAADLAHQGELVRARLDAQSDAVVVAVLEHERTQQTLERALLSPGLERLLVQVLESRLADDLTERVLASPELDRVVEFVATSPKVLDVVTRQTQSLAGEMASGVRARTHSVDDVAERTVRGWLRRPRPQLS